VKVVNTDRFGFAGSTVVVTFEALPSRPRCRGVGDFDQPLGEVFAPGAHTVHLDLQDFGYDYAPESWSKQKKPTQPIGKTASHSFAALGARPCR
jgi:hypothetical protein